jgi:hypothetical protein
MEDKTIDKQLLDMVVKTAVDLTSMPDSYHWTINGVETSVGEIRKQLKRLDCDSMAYLVRSVSSSQKTIRHMQAFLRTSLYNTPDAYALYVKQKQNEASGQGTRDKSTQNWGNGLKRPASRFQNFNQRTYDYSAMEVEFVRKLHQQGRDESRQV